MDREKQRYLDSVYYLCTTKSHNSKTDRESVSFNEEEFEISGKFKDLSESNKGLFILRRRIRKDIFRTIKE